MSKMEHAEMDLPQKQFLLESHTYRFGMYWEHIHMLEETARVISQTVLFSWLAIQTTV